jgi:membrane-bound lytic murein transglycosylase D
MPDKGAASIPSGLTSLFAAARIARPSRISRGQTINTSSYKTAIAFFSFLILASGCVGTTDTRQPETKTLADTAPDVPAYSKLTQRETEATLKRLQEIRQRLQYGRFGDYKGPIRHVWDRILAAPSIRYEDNLRVEKQATVLLRDKKFLKRVSLRAEPFIYYILEEIDKRRLPRELALLPVIESAYRPTAISRSKAAGLWQFIPSTSRFLGMKTNWWYDARKDVITSTRYALDYLSTINKKFDGDWLLTLAAYNAGHGTISRAIARNRKRGKATDYWHLRLSTETMNYVPRFLAATRIFTRPQDYGVDLHKIANRPHLGIANIDSQMDLKLAAELAGLSPEAIKTYNPGFLRWTTAPKGPHRLALPLNKLNRFKQKFAQLDKHDRLRWTQYKVRKGDTLSRIGNQHGVTVSALKSANNLKGTLIRIGQVLEIPRSGSSYRARSNSVKSQDSRQQGYYIVKKGDTLWQIARRHNMTTAALLALNNLKPDAIIQPGQRLRVKTKVALSASS